MLALREASRKETFRRDECWNPDRLPAAYRPLGAAATFFPEEATPCRSADGLYDESSFPHGRAERNRSPNRINAILIIEELTLPKTNILQVGALMPETDAKLEAAFTIHRLDKAQNREAFLKEVGPKVSGIVGAVGKIPVSAELMSACPNLKIVSGFGVGYDSIDTDYAAAHGIIVTNTPDVLNEEVADTALALLLATIRQVPQADRFLRAGQWLKRNFPLTATLRERTVGIVGLGRIGKAIAKRLEAFGISVSYHGRHKQDGVSYSYYPSIVELAAAVDTLIVIIPGGKASYHAINAEVLKALGPNGILVNVSRGTVVDETALIEALKNKTILAAGLDVFEHEPKVPQALIDLDNTVLLPHVGSASQYTRNAMADLVFKNVEAFFSGKAPLTPVPETPWRG